MTGSTFDRRPSQPVRRLLIGLGSEGAGTEILDMATELAGALQTEVAALFVEEELLYNLSELPVVSMVSPHGEILRRPDRDLVSQAIAARARACRRALSQMAETSHLRWSFELQQGKAPDVIAARVRDGDILLIAGMAGTITQRARIEIAARMHATPSANLIVPAQLRQRRGPVIALETNHDHLVELAGKIAGNLGEELLIFAGDGSGSLFDAFHARRLHVSDDPVEVATALRVSRPHLVVAGRADHRFADPAAAAGLVQASGAPVLLLNF